MASSSLHESMGSWFGQGGPAMSDAASSTGSRSIHLTMAVEDMKRYGVIAKYLHNKLVQSHWMEEYHSDMYYGTSNLGVFVQRSDGSYASTTHDNDVLLAVTAVQPKVAFTMSCEMVSIFENQISGEPVEIPLDCGLILPVMDSITSLPACRTLIPYNATFCLCRKERFLLVWADSPPEMLATASELENELVSICWGSTIASPPPVHNPLTSGPPGRKNSYFGSMISPPVSNSMPLSPPVRRALHSSSTTSASPPRMSLHKSVSFAAPYYDSDANTPIEPQISSIRPSLARGSYAHHRTNSQAVLAPSYRAGSYAPDFDVKPGSFGDYMMRNMSYADSNDGYNTDMENFYLQNADLMKHKMSVVQTAIELEEKGEDGGDKEMQKEFQRPFLVQHSILVAMSAFLVVALDFWCVTKLISESLLDGSYLRWILLVTIPFFSFFALFFMIVISGSILQIAGPMANLSLNSKYYSAKPPKPAEHADLVLPHLTIEMPVYKEGLKGVIMPTIESLMKAVRYYEKRGGTATIYVNDDGMQLITPELQEARKTFYELNNIAWCSRPAQCTIEGSDRFFLRKGKFKKASNMNYCLDFSARVEDELIRLMAEKCEKDKVRQEELSIEAEDELYEKARDNTLEADQGRTWSGGDVRMGEFILIVDCDTRVPEECLLYGALELTESPEVAILQHSSGVMNVTGRAFENGITYFTNLVYTSIRFAVGTGDLACFVGHNAFLRWKAVQTIGFQEDGRTKYWSEAHVSEDFDVSLRLQMTGWTVRMAVYHDNQFLEGVSLTVYDELARWEKYAYGCNEMVFHPFRYWLTRGPFTPLFKQLMTSDLKVTSKFTIIAYIGTYYAIASAFPLSILNYVLAGFSFNVDHFYETSWKIFVGLSVVYNLLSPIAFAMLRYRLGEASYTSALKDCCKWMPTFLLFFGGLSFHLSKALLCHFFSIEIEWTTTAKELEKTGLRIGLDRVVRDFKWMYAWLFPLGAAMVYFACYAPRGYRVTDFTVIVPMANQIGCHALLPFVFGLF